MQRDAWSRWGWAWRAHGGTLHVFLDGFAIGWRQDDSRDSLGARFAAFIGDRLCQLVFPLLQALGCSGEVEQLLPLPRGCIDEAEEGLHRVDLERLRER